MNRLGKQIFVVAFFVICLIPVIGMLFIQSESTENRTLSEMPELISEETGAWNKQFFNELSTYVAEHFAFRSQLVEWDGLLKYHLFRSPSDEQVIIGEGDWMFFDGTLQDYTGVVLENERIHSIAEQLKEACAYIESMGAKPLIMLVPNKNSVYEEYMPSSFGELASVTNLTLLQEAMDEQEIPYVDVKALLRKFKDSEELYLHQDTHWNNTGARLVLNQIYTQYGLEDWHSLGDYTIEESHESDLSQMLFPASENLEAQHIYDQAAEFAYVGRVRSMDDLTIRTQSEQGNGKRILVFRDSFGRAMIPYMAEIFDTCTFQRLTPYDLSDIEEDSYDYVLIEIVERNIADLEGIVIP